MIKDKDKASLDSLLRHFDLMDSSAQLVILLIIMRAAMLETISSKQEYQMTRI